MYIYRERKKERKKDRQTDRQTKILKMYTQIRSRGTCREMAILIANGHGDLSSSPG